MDDMVEFGQTAAAKGEVGEAASVERAVRIDDFRPEVLKDGMVNRLAWRHELATHSIGFNDVRAKGAKNGGYAGLSAS
jgi:hypothetical protein